jgi:hypothetical protein
MDTHSIEIFPALNSTTVYRQRAAVRLAEIRQLQSLTSAPMKVETRKVIPWHPKSSSRPTINKQTDPPTNTWQ